MNTLTKKRRAFLTLHKCGVPFIIPNPWDIGSAQMMEGLGFSALATTSSGFACALGRNDYAITRDEALAHASALADSVNIPVSADLENGFDESADMVAQTITLAAQTKLCGGSIEDTTGNEDMPIYSLAQTTKRIEAAVQAAKPSGFVLTARADGLLHGVTDLNNIIERMQAFEAAGADILYAPGLPNLDAVHRICDAVSKPVNVLIYGTLTQHTKHEFAQAGAARLSIGGALTYNAYGSIAGTAQAMLKDGNFNALAPTKGAKVVREFLR